MDIETDGHVHTKYCGHAIGEMEEYVQAAIRKGLKKIIFLEHFEAGISYFESTWLTPEKFAIYWSEGSELRGKYAGQIEVGLGVEVGFNSCCADEISEFLGLYKWDRVGLSCHFFPHKGRHVNMLSRKNANLEEFTRIGVANVLEWYLGTLFSALRLIPADVLCHLDAALRYHDFAEFGPKHLELMREVLKVAAERNVALEVNTSGIPLRGEPFPSKAILKMAKIIGLNFVAGSDAHRPEDVGRHFDQLPQFLGCCS